jgi:acetoin utilization protein AcuB
MEVKMFVGERMSHPVISVTPDVPIHDVLVMFKKEHIRRAPVMKDGKLVGIVSQHDLLNASPSPVTSLSVWEMNYLISKVTVKQVMSKKVKTIDINTPIEEAARIMADSKIGGMPVMRSGQVVGVITETDLFKTFLELMGARTKGIRVTAEIDDEPGTLAKVTKAIADAGGDFISFGQFSGSDTNSKVLTFKVSGLKKDVVEKALTKHVKKFWDIRQS